MFCDGLARGTEVWQTLGKGLSFIRGGAETLGAFPQKGEPREGRLVGCSGGVLETDIGPGDLVGQMLWTLVGCKVNWRQGSSQLWSSVVVLGF